MDRATYIVVSCMQYHSTNVQDHIDILLEQFEIQKLNRTRSMSKDCLTVSVRAPTTQASANRTISRSYRTVNSALQEYGIRSTTLRSLSYPECILANTCFIKTGPSYSSTMALSLMEGMYLTRLQRKWARKRV
jgi:hypothetical protein